MHTRTNGSGKTAGHSYTDRLQFGIIGAGGIAQTYAQACSACEEVKVAAVADIRPDAASALAEGLKCQWFDSYEVMLDKTRFDAVIVCTPPATHCDICVHALERGIHVLCEKPLTLDVRSALRMAETARNAGLKLTMGSKFRYADDVVRAKSIVLSGILGEIILFENVFTSRVNMSSRWNSDPRISGGGVLIDNGSHSVDLVRYFLGPLADLQVVEGKRVQGLAVEDTVRMSVRSVGGVMGSVDLSWSMHKEQESYIGIYGSHGTVFVGWKESKYHQSSSRDWIVFGNGYDKNQAFGNQVKNFARSILGHENLVIDAEDAIASVEAIEAAYVALRQNQWTSVKHAKSQIPHAVSAAQVNSIAMSASG